VALYNIGEIEGDLPGKGSGTSGGQTEKIRESSREDVRQSSGREDVK
jgi:hypothetical protein